MERIMSVEEKIRRAEEIYKRRRGENINKQATVNINTNDTNNKDIILLKKMVMQIIICILIYLVIYIVNNSQFIFSEDFIKKVNEVLSYDTNFVEIYENCKNYITGIISNLKNNEEDAENQNINQDMNNENNQALNSEDTNSQNVANSNGESQNSIEGQNANSLAIGGASGDGTDIVEENQDNLSQEEQDLQNIKATTTFIKPIEGVITSSFGVRDPTSPNVPKNHTGTDIAAAIGTKIKSATEGEVVLASEEGDYGKHLKIQIGEVSIIYAHCNALYVNQGDKVVQGQEIAEVGSTGNSTGPHLHFEVRYKERVVDPQKIFDL